MRGTEGMILAIKWAREQNIPFLGICLGFQLAVIEWVRHVCGQKNATSGEFDPDAQDPVIIFMPEISKTHMGGTMRLGLRPTVFDASSDWSKLRKLYKGADKIWERHRHRYEVNPALIEKIQSSGMPFIGKDEKGERMQILELPSAYSFAFRGSPQPLTHALTFSRHQTTPTSWACKPIPSSAPALSTPHRPSSASSPPPQAPPNSKHRSRTS